MKVTKMNKKQLELSRIVSGLMKNKAIIQKNIERILQIPKSLHTISDKYFIDQCEYDLNLIELEIENINKKIKRIK